MKTTKHTNKKYLEEAELINSRLAMIGFFALIHNYVITGWVIPGFF